MLSSQQRREIQARIHVQRQEIDRRLKELSPGQKRAVFLRIKHDRPLTQKDFAGTGLVFMSGPGETESLVVSKEAGLEKFDERMSKFAEGNEPGRPKGTELAQKLRSLELGEPKDRLSGEVFAAYEQWIRKDWLIYEIEIVSFAPHPTTQKRELESIRNELGVALGHIHGHIFEHEDSGKSCRIVLRSTGAKFREFVEEAKWWRKITYFDERPRFETFSEAFEKFQVGEVSIEAPPADAETICVVDSGVAGENPCFWTGGRRTVRTERWRLIAQPARGAESAHVELFDYEADPDETRNHAATHPEIVSELRARLGNVPEPAAAPAGQRR